MYYTVYQITNLVNGKIYIGKHETNDLNDGYMGSGKLIRSAIEKYSEDCFSKDVLFVFDNVQDMNSKEAELVTEEFCLLNSNYNLCPGGHGGFGYINVNNINGTFEGRIKGGLKSSLLLNEKINNDPYLKKKRQALFDKYRIKHSNEKLLEMSNKARQTLVDSIHIHNKELNISKRVKKEHVEEWLNKGYVRGRLKIFRDARIGKRSDFESEAG